MFGTFTASPSYPTSSTQDPPAKPKRSQVSRACDSCRLHRVKCDTKYPCRNCSTRGWKCSNSGKPEQSWNLPRAMREIETLRARVRELEAQVENNTRETREGDINELKKESDSSVNSLLNSIDGIHLDTAAVNSPSSSSPCTQFYGLSSTYYFIHRINSHLQTLNQPIPQSPHSLIPNSASRSFAHAAISQAVDDQGAESSDTPTAASISECPQRLTDHSLSGKGLSALQEAFFLDLFWDSWHCCYQILDEAEFKAHYKSLWCGSTNITRKPSPLVDIVIALCMQFGVTSLPRQVESKAQIDIRDATIAGRWLYQRCQRLLLHELENPSLTTVQCQFWSAVYLSNASYQNMAQNMLGATIRAAYALGLHIEPDPNMDSAYQEARKRMWWTLFCFETRLCIRLGRPWGILTSQMTCSLPTAELQETQVTWISYTVERAKLIQVARSVYDTFYTRRISLKSRNADASLSNSLELCAQTLSTGMDSLKAWVTGVPQALKTERRGNGEPLSTDLSEIEIELFAPIWLRRQRLMLELQYHDLILTICRICIEFPTSEEGSSTTSTYGNMGKDISSSSSATLKISESAALHAASVTRLLHQVYKEYDILDGWYEPFNYQWNAAITLVGFVLAHSNESQVYSTASEALKLSIEVLERMGSFYGVAASAAVVMKGLSRAADGSGRGLETRPDETDETIDCSLTNLVGDPLVQGLPAGFSGQGVDAVSSYADFDIFNVGRISDMDELFGSAYSLHPFLGLSDPTLETIVDWAQ